MPCHDVDVESRLNFWGNYIHATYNGITPAGHDVRVQGSKAEYILSDIKINLVGKLNLSY